MDLERYINGIPQADPERRVAMQGKAERECHRPFMRQAAFWL